MLDLDGRSRSVPGPFQVRFKSVSSPFQVRFKSVPIYRRYKPHDGDESLGEVRTMVINDEPWFVGKDVSSVLGYERADNAIRSHVEEEDKLMHQISASGQRRQMTIINESGLYALILSSKLPQAKEFKRWVTSEVLPQIRKTGGYIPINGCDLVKRSNGQTFFLDTPNKLFAMAHQAKASSSLWLIKQKQVVELTLIYWI